MLIPLGRPKGYLIFSLMALIGGPIQECYSQGVMGQPSCLEAAQAEESFFWALAAPAIACVGPRLLWRASANWAGFCIGCATNR